MDEQNKTCATCKYFCRHYTRRGKRMFIPLVMGHCGNPRLREKKVDTLACQRYVEVVEDGNGMVERRGVVWERPR